MDTPRVVIREMPLNGTTAVEVVRYVERYRHTLRQQGGFWEATFWIPVSPGVGITSSYLREWYNNRLMFRLDEQYGGTLTWQGVIWEMELLLDGVRKRRSIENLWNAIRTDYTDSSGASLSTAWFTNDDSIKRYGRREQIIRMDNVASAEAEAEAQSELTKLSEPWSEFVGIDVKGDEGLSVTAVGDIFTANNKYTTVATGSPGSASSFITTILNTDCQFLSANSISTNSLVVTKALTRPMRVWDLLLRLTERGDDTVPYRIWVSGGGKVNYAPLDNNVLLQWNGRDRGMTFRAGGSAGWNAIPGVLRDMTEQSGTPIPGSFLQDRRDSWIDQIEMAVGADYPVVKPSDIDEDDLMVAKEQYERWFEMEDSQ